MRLRNRVAVRTGLLGLVAAAALTAATGSASGSTSGPTVAPAYRLQVGTSTAPLPGARITHQHPLMVADPAPYAAAKSAANASAQGRPATQASTAPSNSSLAPTTTRSWQGINNTSHAPSDSTSAVGTTRFVETVNGGYAIYSRTSNTPKSSGPLENLTGVITGSDNIFDPQVIWDPDTNRFYYAADDIVSKGVDNRLLFGYSKTASPSSSADWCKYYTGYGAEFPDYPKLGDVQGFTVIGVNTFGTSGAFRGSDVVTISKPTAGTTCVDASTFKVTNPRNLKNANGTSAFTPVPANQTDPSSTGYIVARPASVPSTGATFLTVFTVSRSSTGAAVVSTTGASVSVPAYKIPADAPQSGTTKKLDTSDTRPTQAVSAVDPGHGSAVGLWTQHTVFGGAGAEVRWYEINPAARTLLQSGKVTSASLSYFNGAISPDRVVKGTTRAFGANMVLDVNSSSSTIFPALSIVSKIGAAAQSAPVLVANSSGPDIGFDCASGTCRWGDYAAATPDPAAPVTGATGQVWGTTMLAFKSSNTSVANWATWNFAAKP